MILFTYRDFFERNHRKFLIAALIWFVGFAAFEIIKYREALLILLLLYPLEPRSLLMTIPSTYLLFLLADFLNKKFPLVSAEFNAFSDVSYMAMLTQHIILYIFAIQFKLRELHTFGILLILFLATATIIYVSNWIKTFSDTAESWFSKRG